MEASEKTEEIPTTSAGAASDELLRRRVRAFADAGVALLKMGTNQASLEDIFIELTNEANEQLAQRRNEREA